KRTVSKSKSTRTDVVGNRLDASVVAMLVIGITRNLFYLTNDGQEAVRFIFFFKQKTAYEI
ncbi:hypothetical protein, partial [Streptococcus suis]